MQDGPADVPATWTEWRGFLGLTAERISEGMAHLAAADRRFAEAAERHGPPEPRIRPPGYETLLRAIVSQQVSTAAAGSIWRVSTKNRRNAPRMPLWSRRRPSASCGKPCFKNTAK